MKSLSSTRRELTNVRKARAMEERALEALAECPNRTDQELDQDKAFEAAELWDQFINEEI